jgi:hypothetical protein
VSLKAAPIREVPEDGELRFAPLAIDLEAIRGGLVVGSGSIGFSLTNGARGPRRLDLVAESELIKVSARGKELSSIQTKRWNLGILQSNSSENFLHKVAATPVYYRVDIRVSRKGSDHVLGEYSSYARVMKPRVDLRVRIATPTVSPGEMAKATLVNLGTVPLVTPSYDHGFSVQTVTDQDWVRVPDNPRRLVPKRMGPWTLGAGMEDHTCLRYRVPGDQAPGLFRFVTFGAGAEPTIGMLAAKFEVVPGP